MTAMDRTENWLMNVLDRLPEGRWLDDQDIEDALVAYDLDIHGLDQDDVWVTYWRPKLIAFGVSSRRLTFSADYSKVWRVS